MSMKPKRVLGTFSLAMITVAAIVSLRNLPISAYYGISSVSYLLLAAIVFFIPIALVTAELATGWPKPGATYVWVSEAFGKPVGFFALWVAWMESIAWFPAILSFSATMLAHLLTPWFPGLEQHKFFIFGIMMCIFWGSTFSNFRGIETSSWVSSIGVWLGTLIPGLLIIALGVWWVLSGKPLHVDLSFDALVPDLAWDNMVLFSGILLGLAGVEIAAFHIREAKDPKRDYPKALLLAVSIILTVSILGTLAIAVVVPDSELSLLSGLIQSFFGFLSALNLMDYVPVLACMLLIGSLAGINTWTVGPAKGLLVSAEDGFLPKPLQKLNKNHVPTGMLIFQGIVGSMLALVFLMMDDTSSAFWILTALSAQFTMVQYLMVFVSFLRLRFKQPKVPRAYTIPGGLFGAILVAGIGIVACVFAFIIAFLPPSQLETGDPVFYVTLLAVCLGSFGLIPIGFIKICRRSS